MWVKFRNWWSNTTPQSGNLPAFYVVAAVLSDVSQTWSGGVHHKNKTLPVLMLLMMQTLFCFKCHGQSEVSVLPGATMCRLLVLLWTLCVLGKDTRSLTHFRQLVLGTSRTEVIGGKVSNKTELCGSAQENVLSAAAHTNLDTTWSSHEQHELSDMWSQTPC